MWVTCWGGSREASQRLRHLGSGVKASQRLRHLGSGVKAERERKMKWQPEWGFL